MVAKELISPLVPPLKDTDTIDRAFSLMSELHLAHLPVVQETKLLGIISEDDLFDVESHDSKIGTQKDLLISSSVFEGQHIYDVINMIHDLKLTIIPVLDVKEKYIGSITLENIVEYFAEMNSIHELGGIISLVLNINDYSLTEISRLVESNDAKILSTYITPHKESTKIELTIKVNKTDLKDIIATFERFEYVVSAYFQDSDQDEDSIKDRYDSLMNYLNI